MFFSRTITDRFGYSQKNFYLTQGDTATIRSVPTKDGELIDFDSISKCRFKLSHDNYVEIFSKDFTPDTGYYTVTLETTDTEDLPLETLIYEVEYTFADGTVNTPNQGNFTILDQIVEGSN